MLLKHDFDHAKLMRRDGPTLADGTSFRELFDFEKREVSLRVMYDPEIHQLELDRVFGRAWIVLGHESEIPNPGDFEMRRLDEDPVIMTRAADGSINLLANICPHRGAEVCAADHGNTTRFTCPYHAWVFDNSGKLVGVPFERQMYPPNWDKSDYGLPRIACTVRHGVIFGNLSDKPMSLEDYLGDMLWYFDALYGGREWTAIPNRAGRYLVNANWKTTADQNQGDFLHVVGAHRSSYELGMFGAEGGGEEMGQYAMKISLPPSGHMLSLFEPNAKPNSLQTQEMLKARMSLPLDQRGWVVTIYPTSGCSAGMRPLPDGTMLMTRMLQSIIPYGVEHFDFSGQGVMLVPADTPRELMASLRRSPRGGGTGVSGIAMEDNNVWRSITTTARTPYAKKATLKYPAVGGPNKPEGWQGPGVIYDGFSHDDSQWHGWMHHYDVMTAG